MARVIVSHFSGIMVNNVWRSAVFYDGLVDALLKAGHDVLQIITNDFIMGAWFGSNRLRPEIDRDAVERAIRDFDPDLIISFNNSTLDMLAGITDAPFIVWDADTIQYFNDRENLIKNKDRYVFFAFSSAGYREFREVLSPAPNRVHRMRAATAVEACEISFRDNISFIGTYFHAHRNVLIAAQKHLGAVQKLIRGIDEKNESTFKTMCKELGVDARAWRVDNSLLASACSGARRNQIVSAVAPLGLRIFGPPSWINVLNFSVDAFLAYDRRLAFSLAHNEEIYNRSKLSINASLGQIASGYPWRVPDIMASNACLISDRKQDLLDDFGKHVDLQTYESPSEAYEVCKALLEDEIKRQDIVAASQEAIANGFTWAQRVREIFEITDVQHYVSAKTLGQYKILDPADFLTLSGKVRKRLLASKRWIGSATTESTLGALQRIPLPSSARRRVNRTIYNLSGDAPCEVYEATDHRKPTRELSVPKVNHNRQSRDDAKRVGIEIRE